MEKRDKNRHLLGFVPHIYFFLLTLLQIFVPHLEILFCINHYFILCIFKYRTSLHFNSGLEIQGCYFYSKNLRSNSTEKKTTSTTTSEGKCVLICDFIRHSQWPLSDIITSFPCAPVISCEFTGVPVCSHVFSMHPNWRLLDIICLRYGLESAFVVDFPIPCVLNVIASNRPQSEVRYS